MAVKKSKTAKKPVHIQPRIFNVTGENVINEILDMANLCHQGEDVGRVLNMLVVKIATIMSADVCSLYLLNPHTRLLVLKATQGLNPDSVENVRMQVGEGLVGKTIEWLKPLSMAMASKSKKFKYFPGTGEERFASFLSVPLIYNRHPIGVLVIQNSKAVKYSQRSVNLLMTLAHPAVTVIEKAKLLGTFGLIAQPEGSQNRDSPRVLEVRARRGIQHEAVGASPGIAIGRVHLVNKSFALPVVPKLDEPIHEDVEKMRVLEAFRWVEEEVRDVQKRAKEKFGVEELSIFDAYQMVLESQALKDQILTEIQKGSNARQAVECVFTRYSEELSLADDEYIRERTYDIQDISRKITDRLLYGSNLPRLSQSLPQDCILLAPFWSISDFVEMDLEKVKGILSPAGGASSHVAILAQSLGIPAVLGLSSFADFIRDGDQMVMDGNSGMVILNPTSEIQEAYQRELQGDVDAQKKFSLSTHKPAVTFDGRKVVVGANLGIVAHAIEAIKNGAEDVGLFRTEFPFLISRSLPTEEEQKNLYTKILKNMDGRSVTIRSLDIGGDKYLPYLNLPKEDNPYLGWRSIRISMEREDLFRIQLRALLRASPHGRLRLLFPMITSMEEVRIIKSIVKDVRRELQSKNIPCSAKIPFGIMIEVPSAAVMAVDFAQEVDFFSIGTNDLIQYTLAVDRNNPKVAKLYNPLHPAVLRLISQTVQAAHRFKKPVNVCGEMAGLSTCAVILIGLGVDSMSMNVPSIPKIKNLICRIKYSDAKKLATRALALQTAAEVKEEVVKFFKAHDLMEFLPHPNP